MEPWLRPKWPIRQSSFAEIQKCIREPLVCMYLHTPSGKGASGQAGLEGQGSLGGCRC